MQSTSQLYKTLRDAGANIEVKAVVDGTIYLHNRIESVKTSSSIFAESAPGIGGCIAKQIDLILFNPGNISRMAEIDLYIRYVSDNQASEWVPKGIYFINTRYYDKESDSLTIHGYDAMIKTEASLTVPGEQGTWPKTDSQVISDICSRIGVTLDSRTSAIITNGYSIPYPGITLDDGTPKYDIDGALSMRECLSYIGMMYAGNWVITDDGKLRLVVLGDIPEETNLLVTEMGDYILIGGVRILV